MRKKNVYPVETAGENIASRHYFSKVSMARILRLVCILVLDL